LKERHREEFEILKKMIKKRLEKEENEINWKKLGDYWNTNG
jgi:hypothetical protein